MMTLREDRITELSGLKESLLYVPYDVRNDAIDIFLLFLRHMYAMTAMRGSLLIRGWPGAPSLLYMSSRSTRGKLLRRTP
jgi:hypothetical protein